MTPAEIMAFQTGRYDWLGKPLKVDGEAGPKTKWALALAQLDPRRQAIVARACGCVGIAERGGANRGPDVEAWLERSGAQPGDPWCASFASWCISVRDMPLVRQASAQALGKSFRATVSPEPGDVMWFPTGEWQGHCGIVIAADRVQVATVEGNNDNAVRCVRRVRRHVRFGNVLPDVEGDWIVPVPPGLSESPVQLGGTR